MELNIRMKFDDASLGVIKSFQNLETLSILSIDGVENEDLFSNGTMFPPRLQRLEIPIIRILCIQVLEIVQHTLVKEIDLGCGPVSGNRIFWSDQCKIFYPDCIAKKCKVHLFLLSVKTFEDSQAFDIKPLDNALIRDQRKLKIFRRCNGSSLVRKMSNVNDFFLN